MLYDSQLFFRSVVENSSNAVVATDERGKILFWNKEAFKVFGYSEKEALGARISIILSDKAQGVASPSFGVYFDQDLDKYKYPVHIGLRNKGGEQLFLKAMLHKFTDNGKLCYYCIFHGFTKVSGEEFSENSHTEEEQDLSSSRNEGISEVTPWKEGARLSLAESFKTQGLSGGKTGQGGLNERGVLAASSEILQKQVENLDAELREFVYIISHDLKAPLRAITILSEWLLSDYFDKFDEEGKERLKLLVGRAKKMQLMIDGVLQYSRIGRSGEEVEEVDPNKLVAEIAEKLELIKGDSIQIDEKLPVVFFDELRLRQVFHNLLMNAVESLGQHKGEIKVNCEERGGFWIFSVTDQGEGIEEKDFKRIFNVFQGLRSKEEGAEGNGMGLTIAKRIIEVSGGEIWLNSKVGEGTTFFFSIVKRRMQDDIA